VLPKGNPSYRICLSAHVEEARSGKEAFSEGRVWQGCTQALYLLLRNKTFRGRNLFPITDDQPLLAAKHRRKRCYVGLRRFVYDDKIKEPKLSREVVIDLIRRQNPAWDVADALLEGFEVRLPMTLLPLR
jgi:hypothetical protein